MTAEVGLSARDAHTLRTLYLAPSQTLVEDAESKLRVLRKKVQELGDMLDDAVAAADKQAALVDLLREGRDTLERLP